MREIKFRYWVGNPSDRHFSYFDPMELDHHHTVNFRTFVLEQFTGLKDKNGREIYEGDFVRHWGEVSLIDSLETVFGWLQESLFFSEDSEIVGNIHENPELLNS